MTQPQTRMTRQRMVILEELRKVKTHPTADELYAMVRLKMPRISLGTVYRNLDFLADSREILKLESAGSIRRFDGDVRPHQHVRCLVCGKVGDVMPPLPVPKVDGIEVEGFTISAARVEYEGICDNCAHLAS
ncbi:MAG: transcriptional repressor [Bilophila sp.]